MVSVLSGPAHSVGEKYQAETLVIGIANLHFPRKSSLSYLSRDPMLW